MSIPNHELERERLKRRIASTSEASILRDLRRFRHQINKKQEIIKRGVRAVPYSTPKGMRFRAFDEVNLCHQFLDQRKIDPML